MRLLLDTHVLLWAATGDPRLSPRIQEAMAAGGNDLLISVASAWEVGIKQSLGRLGLPVPLGDLMLAFGAQLLPITLDHAAAVARLPWHHRDPFDRMLVAQAQQDGLVLASADQRLAAYDIPLLT